MAEYLLDANVVIALTIAEHEHHDAAEGWFAGVDAAWLCPVVEGALLRFLLRIGEHASTAADVLRELHAHPRIGFLQDRISYGELAIADLSGHRQVTDVYLAGLAGAAGLRLATFDAALHRLRPAQTTLLSSGRKKS